LSEAKSGDVVQVHYTGRLDDGTQFDSSSGRDPLEFRIGDGQVIPGFEAGVVGLAVGDSKTFTIPAADAYGAHRSDWVVDVPRDQMPTHLDLTVGGQLQLKQDSGQVTVVTITEVTDDQVTLDANHPLAGQDLTFEVESVAII